MTQNKTVEPTQSIELKSVLTTDLIPYENNPRLNDSAVEGVKKSIESFGFNVPIVVDVNNVVVTGHTRLKAALELGLTSVPVIVASHLSEEQIQAFRLADNRVSENSSWDNTKLQEELQILQSMGIDLSETGFSIEEISCLIDVVKADCLDDLTAQQVCGDISTVVINKNKEAGFFLGDFRFLIPIDQYNLWRKKMLTEHGSAVEVLTFIKSQLGLNNIGVE